MKNPTTLVVNTVQLYLSAKGGSRLFLTGMVVNTWILLFGYSLFSKEQLITITQEYWIPLPSSLILVGFIITLVIAVHLWKFLCKYDNNNTALGRYIAIQEKVDKPLFMIEYTLKEKPNATNQQTPPAP